MTAECCCISSPLLSPADSKHHVFQVVLPDGQLAFVLPLVSAPQAPPAHLTSWPHRTAPLPQQHQQVTSTEWQLQLQQAVPGPVPPPRPPPMQRSALPAKRPLDAAAEVDAAQPCQSRLRVENGTSAQQAVVPPSNQAAALALRSRLRNSTAGSEAGGAAAVTPCDEEPAATQPPVSAGPAPAAGDLRPCPSPPAKASTAQQDVSRQQTQAAAAPAPAAAAQLGNAQQEQAPECISRMAAEGDDTEAVFLGTGAAEPSKYRGASAIHLRCRPDS